MRSAALAFGFGCFLLSPHAHGSPDVTSLEIPSACTQFWPADDEPGWDGSLSFTACMQDATVPLIESPEQAAPVVAELVQRIAPAMRMYLLGLARGPQELQLRAAFQLGLAHVALITRARSAVPRPPDLGDEAAARNYAATHAAVEHELEPFAQSAWLIFAAIDRATLLDRGLVVTEVDRLIAIRAQELRAALAAHAIPWRLGREANRLWR
jgi:hypothetical protein